MVIMVIRITLCTHTQAQITYAEISEFNTAE